MFLSFIHKNEEKTTKTLHPKYNLSNKFLFYFRFKQHEKHKLIYFYFIYFLLKININNYKPKNKYFHKIS